MPPPTVCVNCGGKYQTEIYQQSAQNAEENNSYRCTSDGHKSHGRIVKCLQCGLVYTDTKLTSDAIEHLYSQVEDQAYVENIKARYRTFRYNFSQILPYLPPRGRLLDVGTYCGAFLSTAQEFGFESVGLEPSRWASGYARKVLKQAVIEGTVKDLPDDMEKFDVITLWDVLEHFHNPVAELSLLHTKLKPEGKLVFSTLNIDNWYPKIMGERWPWLMDMHLYYFDKEEIRQILSQTGFELIHSQSYCHFITLDYFFSKIDSLGVWGAKHIGSLIKVTPARNWMIPFRFGDVQLFIAQKVLM